MSGRPAAWRRRSSSYPNLVSIFSTEGAARWPRGVTEEDLKRKNAQFINPKVFADKVVAADKVVSL